ncbi:MAG: translation initiation factor [Opitutales bacterium]
MSRKGKERVETEGKDEFVSSPFSSLSLGGLPEAPSGASLSEKKERKLATGKTLGSGERLEVRREKSGRGGKTVTTVRGFPSHLGLDQKTQLLKRMKTSLGTGGTWNQATMELQGDRRNEVMGWFQAIGFKPVLAGG